MNQLPRLLSGAALAALLLPSTPASAFFEDLCYVPGGGLMQCLPLPANCAPSDDSQACRAGAVAQAAAVGNQTAGGRSMVHVDATYFLAQAVGFDPEAAHWIAAYDEATDLGRYVPADRDGVPVVDPALCDGSAGQPAECADVSALIDGVTRNNMATGGIALHFIAPNNPAGDPLDGLAPHVDDPFHEVALVNFRRWAFAAVPACVGGLTEQSPAGDFATGGQCADLTADSSLDGQVPVLGAIDQGVPMSVPLGEQILQQGAAPADDVLVGDIAGLTGPAVAPWARMGVYLHVLQDRISHHICGDVSTYEGPIAPEQDFLVAYDGQECAQPIHVLRHVWEVGVPQAELDAQDRTTGAALAATYDELFALAQQLGVARSAASRAAYRQGILTQIGTALEIADPMTRQDTLASRMAARGFAMLRGYLAP